MSDLPGTKTDSLSSDARAFVAEYGRICEDRAYVRRGMAAFGAPRLLNAMQELLTSSDEEVHAACVFIRDLVLLAAEPESSAFREAFSGSAVPDALGALLVQGSFAARRHAVYTLGKTGQSRCAPAVRAAFSRWLAADPLFLPRLAFEQRCLEGRGIDPEQLASMVSSPEYVTRWAALEVLRQSGASDGAAVDASRALRALADDEHPLVRRAARHALDPEPNPAEGTLVTFGDLETWFGNHLHEQRCREASVSELHAFIERDLPTLLAKRGAYWRDRKKNPP